MNYTPYFTPVPNSGNGINCLYGPSSQHPGGVNHLFGDGSVHVLSPTINFNIYNALVTIAGSEVVEKNDY
jgi:prepilin-type processing-associated H-X9-DG protein